MAGTAHRQKLGDAFDKAQQDGVKNGERGWHGARAPEGYTIIGMCESPTRCTISDRGLRCTSQREAVLGVLQRSSDHPTAETLHERLEGVSLATVYNALAAFERVGLAQPIAMAGGLTRWDGSTSMHAHVRRSGTDVIEDLPEDLADPLLEALTPQRLETIGARMGGRVSGVQIKIMLAGGEGASEA